MTAAWWRDAVLYQIYPRSFMDTNGDGVGDIRGITSRLDYLEWLGIDGIWLNPVMPSPNRDWGYDVSDYCGVHPELGDIDAVDELLREAARRNIRVIFDLVPNHTSDQHAWFRDARRSRDAGHREFYVWADPKAGGHPNNWLSVFGGESAWELDPATGQYYLHNFLKEQPDLNWWNDEVRAAFDEIIEFWFDRGVAGFRIDVAHALIHDRELRDNPPATDDDDVHVRLVGQRPKYNMNRPEVHEILRHWRKLFDQYDPARLLVGETFVLDIPSMVSFYGKGTDELDLAFNMPFLLAPFARDELKGIVALTQDLMPLDAWPVWTASNHDSGRFASRWCEEDHSKIRSVIVMLLCLRGTPFLYYGDEIGMTEAKIIESDLKDPIGERFWPMVVGRDPSRTPMQWSSDDGAGFTSPDVQPWLPFSDLTINVADQRDDPASTLNLCRDLIALRRQSVDLRRGQYMVLEGPESIWTFKRGEATVIALNMTDERHTVEFRGKVLISTRRERDGSSVDGSLDLMPWEAVVAESREHVRDAIS